VFALAVGLIAVAEPVRGAEGEATARSTTQPTSDAAGETVRPQPADDELIRRMLDRAAGEGDDEEVLQRVMRLMEASRLRLAAQFDPGEQTQRVQRRILDDLDEAIKRSGKRRGRPQQKQQQKKSADRRSRGQRQQQQQQQKQNKAASDQRKRAGDEAPVGRGEAENGKVTRTPVERGRQWGNLPARDRDAVLQGIKDDYLPKFKEMIERYYKALGRPESER